MGKQERLNPNQLWTLGSSSPKPATTCSNNASANKSGLLLFGDLHLYSQVSINPPWK